jgi:hypothetical protein
LDILTFIVELIKALAWPASIIVVALLFRKQLVSLLAAIKKGKFGPAEFEFEREISYIEAHAELPVTPAPVGAFQTAAEDPRGAILTAWLKVEERIIRLVMGRGLTNGPRRSPHRAYEELLRSGLLSESSLEVLKGLRWLRNEAAHAAEFTPTPNAVVSYMRLAADLTQELEQLALAPPGPTGGA